MMVGSMTSMLLAAALTAKLWIAVPALAQAPSADASSPTPVPAAQQASGDEPQDAARDADEDAEGHDGAGGQDPDDSEGGSDEPAPPTAGADADREQPEGPEPERRTEGLFVRRTGQKYFTFEPWVDEFAANEIFAGLKDVGGEVHFAPGRYVVQQGFILDEVPDLTVSGSPGVVIEFADPPPIVPLTTDRIPKGTRKLMVDRPELIVPGWAYQIYSADGKGDRILEFRVESVEDGVAQLEKPAVYMPHVKGIPVGSQVLVQVNGFQVRRCPGLVIQNFTIDGHDRGDVRGHTCYCGVVAVGNYKAGQRPTTFGLTVRGCTFRGLKGRGIAFYGIDEGLLENNMFQCIRAQAMEVDHFSSGHVIYNYVDGAQTGVTLNDSFEALVEGNALTNCDIGVYFMRIYPQRWVNTDNEVYTNAIGPGTKRGVVFRDEGIEGNDIRGNRYIELEERFRKVDEWAEKEKREE